MHALDGVIIGPGTLKTLGPVVTEIAPTNRVFLCADKTVMTLLGSRITDILESAGLEVCSRSFAAGEKSKSLESASDLFNWLAYQEAERREPLIALGGGVTGDLVGLVAATYSRGIPLVQIPTTLLAQIDSSIGGKVAIDLVAGKNLVGAFYPATRVIVDPEVLVSLDRPQLIADYAEVVKTAVLFDADMFALIENSKSSLDDQELLANLIDRCIRWKAKIVDQDPSDRGLRAILNYGHTIAHAIETTSGYGKYRHGEAVAMGMVGAGQLAVHTGRWTKSDADRQEQLLRDIGLPVRFHGSTVDELLDAIQRDKKVQSGRVRWVLPDAIGRASIDVDVDDRLVKSVLVDLMEDST